MSEKYPELYARVFEVADADCLIRVGIEIVRNVGGFPEAAQAEASASEVPERESLTMREAVLQMQQGRSVRRSDWQPKKHIGLASNGNWLFRQDGRRYMPTVDDILADDWETV